MKKIIALLAAITLGCSGFAGTVLAADTSAPVPPRAMTGEPVSPPANRPPHDLKQPPRDHMQRPSQASPQEDQRLRPDQPGFDKKNPPRHQGPNPERGEHRPPVGEPQPR